jgi:drug/metabolite transporter (DMT)-like permease
MTESFKYFICLFVACLLAAWLAVQVRADKLPWYYTLVGSIFSALIWSWIMKTSSMKISTASITYDIVANLGWAVALFFLGERFTTQQWIGVGFFLMGLLLV